MGATIKKAEALAVVNKLTEEEVPLSDLQKQLKEYCAAMSAKDPSRAMAAQMSVFKTSITGLATALCMFIGIVASKLIGLF